MSSPDDVPRTRRELLRLGSAASAVGTAGAVVSLAGCTGGCRGVAFALELHATDDTNGDDVLRFDASELSDREREILDRATRERVTGCTRDESATLESLIQRIGAHASVSDHELYYSEGRAETFVRYRGTLYRAVIVYDTAESEGGPLDA